MTVSLPFAVAPKPETVKVGNAACGVLEIQKFNDLTPVERVWIRQQKAEIPNTQSEGVKLARKLSQTSGLPLVEVFQALMAGNLAYLADYTDEVLNFVEDADEFSQKQAEIMASAILLHRVSPEWKLEFCQDEKIILPELVSLLETFANNEAAHWAGVKPEPVELTEEALGNS